MLRGWRNQFRSGNIRRQQCGFHIIGTRRVVANWVYLAGEMAGDVMQRAPPIKWMVPTVAALALAAVVVMRPRLR